MKKDPIFLEENSAQILAFFGISGNPRESRGRFFERNFISRYLYRKVCKKLHSEQSMKLIFIKLRNQVSLSKSLRKCHVLKSKKNRLFVIMSSMKDLSPHFSPPGENRDNIFTHWFQLDIPIRRRTHKYVKSSPSPSATTMGESTKKIC